jgi:serine phosphatase RsbU (regulator of sigma subunit)
MPHTDGLTESASARGELFGTDRVYQEVGAQCGLRSEAFVRTIRQAVEAHSGSAADRDDVTMLWAGSEQVSIPLPTSQA